MANRGQVTTEARAAFEESVRLKPDNPRAAFFLALGLAQDGRIDEARAAWKGIIAKSPADAPWIPLVQQHIASLDDEGQSSDAPGNPTAADIEAAGNMSKEERQEMVRSMVASLAEKLEANPDNFEGWMRLVRSYAMLKEQDKAQDALKKGLGAFPPDQDQGKALLSLAKQLGLSTDGVKP
jgi:cytochrome c-type biogenesis protein CcmH